jgi:D-alanyl-D-alanine carboxypeptidase (penicillin-binding protein 5/6)
VGIVSIIVAVVGTRSERLAAVNVHAAGAVVSAADLPRPPWYGLRVLNEITAFTVAPETMAAPVIHAAGGILVDLDEHTILWQQNAHAQLPPASTTKILTALVALENFSPERRVTVTSASLHQGGDETRMGLKAGETFTVRELLTGALMISGNDAATAIAQDTVGMDRFVAAMNAQVTALGLHDSHFTTPVGLQDEAMHSSAYDLAVISAAAVTHSSLFRQIIATREATLPATADHPRFELQSSDLLLSMYPDYAVGIKPGWTGDAGPCEVGMAVRGGHRLISVLLNAPLNFTQSRRLLDWGFGTTGLPSTLPTPTPSPSPHG